jgi:molybdopterin-guanine dinucleotide biosynthesis protein A
MTFDAVILAGGEGIRLGGVDKAMLRVDGSTLLELVLDATVGASKAIVVGPPRDLPLPRSVEWTREVPEGGGPVAALAAGLDRVERSFVLVVAVDMPYVTRDVVVRLVDSSAGDRAVLVADAAGKAQPLLASYPVDPLRHRLRALGRLDGLSMTRLVEGLSFVTVSDPVAARDCDTPADLELACNGGGG